MMYQDFKNRHGTLVDIISFVGFLLIIIFGAIAINAFVFRSFNVVGPSMENTLHSGDRLVVNKIPETFAKLQGKEYVPERGQIIVFTNPLFNGGRIEEFVVKRVVGLPGERVRLQNGVVTVYNSENPDGFNPDELHPGPKSPTEGDPVDVIVPRGELFVMGDNRVGNNSLDSRNGLGTIPLNLIQGTVAIRLFPLQDIRLF